MPPRLPAERLRVLGLASALIVVGVATLVPRPTDEARAVPPSTWTPIPEELLAPVRVETPPRPAALSPSRVASRRWRSRNPEVRLIAPATADERAAAEERAARSARQALPAERTRPPKGVIHVVVPGDDLWTIALRHSASLAAILSWNDRADPDRLVAGQPILVPGGKEMRPAKPRTVARSASRAATTPPSGTKPSGLRPPPTPRSGGDHLWPLAVRGVITRSYSAAHPGIDIAAPAGTPVRAIARGTVTWAGWKSNGGGFVVVLRHPDGMVSTYNHNSRVVVAVGDTVARGETIARVGATGWATGPHLDIRIEMGGRSVDPRGLL